MIAHYCDACGMPCEYEDRGTCTVCSMASDREMDAARTSIAIAERHYAVALTAYRATLRHLADPGPDGDRRSDHPTDRFYRQLEASD